MLECTASQHTMYSITLYYTHVTVTVPLVGTVHTRKHMPDVNTDYVSELQPLRLLNLFVSLKMHKPFRLLLF